MVLEHIQYEAVNQTHAEAALALALSAYRKERETVTCLPEEGEFRGMLAQGMHGLFSSGTGMAAVAVWQPLGQLLPPVRSWREKARA